MRLIKPSDEVMLYIMERLAEKTNAFDYYTKEGFMEIMKQEDTMFYESEFSWYFCKIQHWDTGLCTMSIDQCSRPDKSGGIQHMKDNLPVIEEHAKLLGVDRILFEGRNGVARVFPDFNKQSITLWRDL